MKTIVCFLISFAFVSSAHATLIDNTGYFTDDTAGLNWRKMSFTDGLSYNQAVASTLTGGINEGYRVATGAEVLNLFNTYIPTELTTATSFENVGSGNGPDPDYQSIIGYTSTLSGSRHLTVQLHDYENGGDIFFGYDRWGYADSVPNGLIGTYLVASAATVPEPATIALLGLGLAALGFSRRKRIA